ncbi:hypothetical protein GCM10025734_15230 [Kitasatospora paranensis]
MTTTTAGHRLGAFDTAGPDGPEPSRLERLTAAGWVVPTPSPAW